MVKLTKSIEIFETVLPAKDGCESRLLCELLKMSGVRYKLSNIRGDTSRDEFLGSLLACKGRFIHVSAHGGDGCLAIHGARGTEVCPKHIEQYMHDNCIGDSPLRGRFISISACGEISCEFHVRLGDITGAAAIVSPLADVQFDESAMFYVLLYYSLIGHRAMNENLNTGKRISHYIDAFQRAKMAYLGIGGTGAFRLDYWWKSKHEKII